MEIFHVVLILCILIGLSNILNRFIPFIPVPLIQIALGAIVAIMPWGIEAPLNPELFFVLFIAPLLFNDGMRTPREELWKLRAPILLLALGLVFVTVFVAGYAIHWLIPSIPLSAAFALAAILSPTDAVAVGSLAGRINLPKGIMRLLEGEALMNDASGLVAFKFAVAATVTGYFSITEAAGSFLVIALGGLLIGAVLSYLIIRLRIGIRHLGMEDATMHMLIKILTPFIIYLAAEELHVSGILAVVAGGIVQAIARERSESSMVRLRIVSDSTWSVILFVLNGLVFVILGLQIPKVESVIINNPYVNTWQAIGYVILVSILLIGLRFIWVWLFWKGSGTFGQKERMGKPNLKSVALIALSGVRGAVTLAGAFSIPLFLQDGTPFPERDLIIFLAAGVILVTLITASVILPLLSKGEAGASSKSQDDLLKEARIKVAKKAIQAVKNEMNEENMKAGLAVIAEYDKVLKSINVEEDKRRLDPCRRRLEKEIRLLAFQAELKELDHLFEMGKISEEGFLLFRQAIEKQEIAVSSPFNKLKLELAVVGLLLKRTTSRIFLKRKRTKREIGLIIKNTKIKTIKAAIQAIHEQANDQNRDVSQMVIGDYERIMARLLDQPRNKEEGFIKLKKEIFFKAIQAEREEVQNLFETRAISREVANKLRYLINYSESQLLVEEGGH